MNCDGCTMCCNLLYIPWMDSPAGEWCKNCDIDKGCKIYNTAPKKCLNFNCAYKQMKKASINLRPDKSRVIFEKIGEKIFIGTVDPKATKLQEIVLRQVDSFLTEGFSVVLFNQKIKEPLIYPTLGITQDEVWKIVQMEAQKLDDRA